jgi:hypothetical protein
MPHFHFHVALRGDRLEDRDGRHYFDVGSAKVYGRRLALALVRTGNFTGATVLVVDGPGREVGRFPVSNGAKSRRDPHARDPGSDTRQADPDRVRADVPSGGK